MTSAPVPRALTSAASSAAVPACATSMRGWVRAAETETDAAALLDRARRKRRRKGVDLLAVNEVGWQKGFESADNTVTLLGADDQVIATVSGTKREVADALWDAVLSAR